jgi:S-adenosylmethionine uptake transporter
MSGNALKGSVFALLSMGIYATHDTIVKTLGTTYSAFQIIFFAALFSFPLVSLLLLRDKSGATLRPIYPGWVALRTAFALITGVAAFYAFSVLPLAQTYAILFATPLLITILAIPILGERVRLRRWAAVSIGLLGVLVVLRPGTADLGLGHVAALTAAICGAMVSVIVRKIGHAERSVVLLIYPTMTNFVVMGAILPFVYVPMPAADLGLMALIALFGLTASMLLIMAYKAAEAVIVAPMQYSQILWATGYGWFLFEERIDSATLIGASIIIASGLYIVFRENRGEASQHQPVLQTPPRAESSTAPRTNLIRRLLNPNTRIER